MLSNDMTLLVECEIDEDARTIEFRWADGHAHTYPMGYVRGHCPCDICRERKSIAQFKIYESVSTSELEPIGSYVMRFYWSDGHSQGTYTHRKLRELCPCKQCRPRGVPEIDELETIS